MHARKITNKDGLIRELLQDPLYRVTAGGQVLTRTRRGPRGAIFAPWRRAGWVSPSRGGTKLYRRVQYRGEELYEHRIVCAAKLGRLSQFETVNHKDLNGLNNHPRNLEMVSPGENIQHAQAFYRRSGMSAAEARANWIKGSASIRGTQHGKNQHRGSSL